MNIDFTLEQLPVAADGKNNRHGKAAILKPEQLGELFDELESDRDRFLFGLCYFTASRITETLTLTAEDIRDGVVTFRAATTKKRTTRQAHMHPSLVGLMDAYIEIPSEGFIFPGRHGRGRLQRQSVDRILRKACEALRWSGVSTHSFRRSFVTQMYAEGKTPGQIQQYTGHKSLGSLLHYIGA